MKKLIVNADDFGYSRHTDEAIIECFNNGIVTSTSFIANTNRFNESVKLLKSSKIDVGIHVNLTEFSPLTKTKTLKGRNGNFIPKEKWLDGFYKTASQHEIEAETEAQIKKALSAGLRITHLDGHNHIHIFPIVLDIILKLAKSHGIRYVRLPHERMVSKNQKLSSQLRKSDLMSKFSKTARAKINKMGLKTNGFYGILDMDGMDISKLGMILKSIPKGTSELMVHPAFADKKGDMFHRSRQRERELRLLTGAEAKKLVSRNGIKLANFKDN